MSARGGCNHCFTLCSSLFVNLFAKVMLNLQGCRFLLSIGGIICNFTQFCPIFNIGGINLNHDFFLVNKLSKDQKKSLHQKWNTFFSQNSSGHLRSDAHQSQNIGGDADVDHIQIIGGIQSNYWGRYIPPGFGTPVNL